MSIKYKIFLAIFGIFLTSTHVFADCIVTNNNFNKSSKIIFVNPNNGSDQLAKTYNLDNVRNPYEAKSVAAFQSIEKAKSLANSSNGDLVLIKTGPQWTNYDAWEGNKLSDFNKEVMKAKGMSQGQCQGESLTWVPSAVIDNQPDQQSVTTDLVSNNDEVTLASTEETAPISLPNISSANTNASKNISTSTQQSLNNKSSGSSSSGGGINKNSPKDGKQTNEENISSEILNSNNKTIIKTTKNGNVRYTDTSSFQNAIDEENQNTEVINIVNQPNIDESSIKTDNTGCKVKKIGINTGDISYFGVEMPLYNLAKQARSWSGDNDLDENGYIKSVDAKNPPYAIISDDLWGRDRQNDKRYVLLYDGEGELKFSLSGAPTIINKKPNRIELELKNERFALVETNTNPSNYIRNIRIVPIDREFDYQINNVRSDYVAKWSKFGVIRYLNLQRTNNSKEVNWSDRKTKDSFGGGAMSLEEIVDISNAMKSNPWLMVPHMATDDYITKMAQYVRDNLDSNLTVYIEYSNETWNYGFEQTRYLHRLAEENNTTIYYEYGVRAKRVFEIWTNILGQSRLNRVIGTQFVNPWVSEQIIKTPGLADLTDSLAVGYYIGNSLQDSDGMRMTEDEIIDFLENTEISRAKDHLKSQKQIADNYNIELVAYEAGQHLVVRDKSNTALVNKYTSANRSPRMRNIYHKMYDVWKGSGGGLIVWFQTTGLPSKWGAWGILEYMGQNKEQAPKYMAIQDILDEEGCY